MQLDKLNSNNIRWRVITHSVCISVCENGSASLSRKKPCAADGVQTVRKAGEMERSKGYSMNSVNSNLA